MRLFEERRSIIAELVSFSLLIVSTIFIEVAQSKHQDWLQKFVIKQNSKNDCMLNLIHLGELHSYYSLLLAISPHPKVILIDEASICRKWYKTESLDLVDSFKNGKISGEDFYAGLRDYHYKELVSYQNKVNEKAAELNELYSTSPAFTVFGFRLKWTTIEHIFQIVRACAVALIVGIYATIFFSITRRSFKRNAII